MKLVCLITTFFILISFNASAQKPAPTIPDFTFFRLDNTPFKTGDLQKDKQLFFVFFDTECEHCQRAMTYLNGHYDDFKKAAIQLITLDSPEKLNAFFPKYGPTLRSKKNITLLIDKQYQFIPKFGPKKYPSMYLYAADKKLVKYEDDDSKVSEFGKAIKAGK